MVGLAVAVKQHNYNFCNFEEIYYSIVQAMLYIENYCHDINIYSFLVQNNYTEWHDDPFFLQQCSYSKPDFWNF